MKTEIIKNTLDQIPQSKPDAKRITALVKDGSRDISFLTKALYQNRRLFLWRSRVILRVLV